MRKTIVRRLDRLQGRHRNLTKKKLKSRGRRHFRVGSQLTKSSVVLFRISGSGHSILT